MGWCGYTIYSGDDTQTRHYDFIKWAKISKDDDEIGDWLELKTKIPKDKRHLLTDNADIILKKMPKTKFWDEDKAIEWQMLLALYLDNKVIPPKIIYDNGILGTEYLMGEHAEDFDNPSSRKKNLRNFIARAKKICRPI